MADDQDVEDFLEHFGVRGMHWGQRKDRVPGVPGHVNRMAKQDAHEHARAAAFFGEGAGTRRKLIKQTVDSRSAKVPGYKKAFDHHRANQDMSKHVNKAVSERVSTDRNARNKQRAGAVLRRVTGEMGTQAAIVATVAGGAAFVTSPKGRALASKTVSKLKEGADFAKQKRGAAKIADFLKNSA